MLMRLLDFFIKRNVARMDGYKTIVGGVGMILVGILGLMGNYFPDQGLPALDLEAALTTIASGFAVLGIGGKLEKSTVATKNLESKLGSKTG